MAVITLITMPFRVRVKECHDKLHKLERMLRAFKLDEYGKFRYRIRYEDGSYKFFKNLQLIEKDLENPRVVFAASFKPKTTVIGADLIDDEGYIIAMSVCNIPVMKGDTLNLTFAIYS